MTTPTMLNCDQVRAEIEAMEKQFHEQMRKPAQCDIFDGNWTWDTRQHVVGEISGSAEEILNDTGSAEIKMFGSHKLADWIDDELDDDEDLSDEDEDALIEVQEFVRIGVLLLHTECATAVAPVRGSVH